MTPTVIVLLGGLGVLLVGIGLLGTLLGVRATLEAFTNAEIGVVMAGYYAGYILGTYLGPGVIRQVGHIRSFAAFAALGAVSILAFGLWPVPWLWLPLRILNGVAVVGVYMVVESWLNEQTPGPSRGRVLAVYMTSTLVALALGQYLLLVYDPAGLESFALATLLVILGLLPVAVTRVHEPRIELAVPLPLRELYRVSPLGALGSLGAGVVNGAFWGMTPVFAQRLGMEPGAIATLMSATILGGATLQWPVGHLSDRHDRRTVLVLVALASAGVALAGAAVVLKGLPGLVPVAFAYGGLMFSLYGISVAHANDHLAPGQTLGATRGLLLLYGLGALGGPLLAGATMQAFGPVALPVLSAAVLAAVALFGVYRIIRRAPLPTEEQTQFVPLVRTTPVAMEMHPDADPAPELDLPPADRR
jgi:MFS family permease